jgi:hypothetical protein
MVTNLRHYHRCARQESEMAETPTANYWAVFLLTISSPIVAMNKENSAEQKPTGTETETIGTQCNRISMYGGGLSELVALKHDLIPLVV